MIFIFVSLLQDSMDNGPESKGTKTRKAQQKLLERDYKRLPMSGSSGNREKDRVKRYLGEK